MWVIFSPLTTSIKNRVELNSSSRNFSKTLTENEQALIGHHVNIWFLVKFFPISNLTPFQTDSFTVDKDPKQYQIISNKTTKFSKLVDFLIEVLDSKRNKDLFFPISLYRYTQSTNPRVGTCRPQWDPIGFL